jgi:hypothetical protein
MVNCDGFGIGGRCLIEVLSVNFLEVTEGNHEKPQHSLCPG